MSSSGIPSIRPNAFGNSVKTVNAAKVQPRIIISRIAGANWAIHSASSATA